MEKWKRIEGFSRYRVSDKGRVLNVWTDKILKINTKPKYSQVGLVNDEGITKCLLVHRLVAQAFIPNPDNKPTVNHKNGDKHDNDVDNLEWATQQENVNHAFETGLKNFGNTPRGSKHGTAKLTDIDIMYIRKRVANGESQNSLAKEYQLTIGAVNQIIQGTTWGHLPIYVYEPFTVSKEVIQFDVQGNELARYSNCGMAGKVIGLDRTSIQQACTGKSKTAGGFIWRYTEGNTLPIEYSMNVKMGRPRKGEERDGKRLQM